MQAIASSYRDPSGFVFENGGKFYRYIAPQYFGDYEMLMESGLYKALRDANRLVAHEEVTNTTAFTLMPDQQGKIILPEQIPFISYPYEWSFDMWRDAALVTLKIASAALEKNMVLKDATPFNIQFFNGRPVFIDTLSFEQYATGTPWVAYRQFCECFLGPLLLMHYGHRDMGKLFLAYPEGIPLEVIKSLLPLKAKWNIHVYMHIFLQEKIAGKKKNEKEMQREFSKAKLALLIRGLENFVSGLKPKSNRSAWDDYYTDTVLGADYLAAKEKAVRALADEAEFNTVLDLGANDGLFSLLLKDKAEYIIATDADSNCINALYKITRLQKIKNILPLVSALHTPSPAIGWANAERTSLTQRLKADLVLALALVHHLAISNNLPLDHIAQRLQGMGEWLIIEFVPKSDVKTQQLLASREDIFHNYSYEKFKESFAQKFDILREDNIGDSGRIIFLMKRK